MSRLYRKKHEMYPQPGTWNFVSDRSGFIYNSKDLLVDHHGYALHWSEYDPPDLNETAYEHEVPIEYALPFVRPEQLPVYEDTSDIDYDVL